MVEYVTGLDRTYHALADSTRRDVLQRLSGGPARVTDVAAARAISLAATSKHIRVLEESGLVRRSVVGREHWLIIEANPLSSASAWLQGYRRFWEANLDHLDRELRKGR